MPVTKIVTTEQTSIPAASKGFQIYIANVKSEYINTSVYFDAQNIIMGRQYGDNNDFLKHVIQSN